MKPNEYQRRLAKIVAEVFGIDPKTLTDKRIVELSDGLLTFFEVLLENTRKDSRKSS